MPSDQIIKAYVKRDYTEFKLLYSEIQKPLSDGSVGLVSVYKNTKEKSYCIVATIKKNGDYTFFTDDRFNAGIYSEDKILRTNVTNESMKKLEFYSALKRKIFSSLSEDKNLPSVLSVGTTDKLTFYYSCGGVLRVSSVENGSLNIELPEKELKYLTEVLSKLGIYVVNLIALGVDYIGYSRDGRTVY